MRQRKWTFYRVMLYLGLVAALGVLGILTYYAVTRFRTFRRETYFQLVLLSTLLQVLFYVLSIRLIHYYVPNRVAPGKTFSTGHLLLLILNGGIAIGWLLLLAFGFSEMFLKVTRKPPTEDYIAFCIIAGYTFITIYIPAASIVLRRYNRYQVSTDEEAWLQQLGNHSLNE